ncbi:Uncharacterized protein BP5553_03266 [Venustampulla echinocandica]|uniref:TECPR1-like DysF domain-containing protein n=1 Tax=Venustampulla echinocandica TaxID=2656787 RepID=A0A370TTR4_9HELO|nr:Uncharacterized protein BP5553_03266 [Venustampulla echinocandica]RDL38926.1 Uncharacterized protein BP5553_03266 [Venustampulla echinocandica]
MEEYTDGAFANRGGPNPVIHVDRDRDDAYSSDQDQEPDPDQNDVKAPSNERKRDRLKRHGKNIKQNLWKAHDKASDHQSSMQDRLLEKLLQQIIPIEDQSSHQGFSSQSEYPTRPSFNLPTMSNNFRRFNARIGVVFVFQSSLIALFTWRHPTHTMSFLSIYTFLCLDPYLLAVVPLVFLILGLLIPSFIARHPAPPSAISTISPSLPYPTTGPPLAPAPTVKPAKELSRDFFRNMRDLQNTMDDFARAHDQIVQLLSPPTNFSNEALSSTLFLFAFLATLAMLIASHLLPWRTTFLLAGWAITCLGHPTIQRKFISMHKQHLLEHRIAVQSWLNAWTSHDIILDSAPQTREVEVFELEKLSSIGEWEPWLFTSSPYDPLSESRIRSERPRGTRFFEDVRAPEGWEWSEKKWALDLWSREWVEERIITGVEVETEGERWVYDLRYEAEYDDRSEVGDVDYNTTLRKGENLKAKRKVLPSWEEGSDAESGGRGRRGEWRRRRWVRMVKRKWQAGKSADRPS